MTKWGKSVTAKRDAGVVDSILLALRSVEGRTSREAKILDLPEQLLVYSRRSRQFSDRGIHELKGVPDVWQLYAVAGRIGPVEM